MSVAPRELFLSASEAPSETAGWFVTMPYDLLVDPALRPLDKVVLQVVAAHAYKHGECLLPQPELAALVGRGVRQLRASLTRLLDGRYIAERHVGANQMRAYRPLHPRLLRAPSFGGKSPNERPIQPARPALVRRKIAEAIGGKSPHPRRKIAERPGGPEIPEITPESPDTPDVAGVPVSAIAADTTPTIEKTTIEQASLPGTDHAARTLEAPSPAPASGPSRSARRRPRTEAPETIAVTPKHYEVGASVGYSREEVDDIVARMPDRCAALGLTYSDWHRASLDWIKNQVKYEPPKGPARRSYDDIVIQQAPSFADVPAVEAPTKREADRIWSKALDELKLGMSGANFESYLAQTTGLALDGSRLTIGVPKPYIRATLETRFRNLIDRALFDVSGAPCRVELVDWTPAP